MLKLYLMLYVSFQISQLMRQDLISFDELVKLKKMNQTSFDSTLRKMNFGLTQIKHDAKWKSERFIYVSLKPNVDIPIRIERIVDSVNFGKSNKLQLIITIDISMYSKPLYYDLLKDCKNQGYIYIGSNNYDREYPNLDTQEYRNGADIAKFSIGESEKGIKQFYKISLSISPK